jgi:hypothetical protein
MQRTATYWPPDSWKTASPGQNVAVHVQAIWTQNGPDVEVFLGSDVAEGGYLYDGISSEQDPTMQVGASKIALFLSHPDLRLLKQVRKAVLS